MKRIEGWEDMLAEAIEKARNLEYAIGSHDCALFVNQILLSTWGIDYSKKWKEKYKTERDALRVIAALGFRDLKGATTAILETAFVNRYRLRRGDPALYIDQASQQHLGICVGATIVCLLEKKGIIHIPLDMSPGGWRVGG